MYRAVFLWITLSFSLLLVASCAQEVVEEEYEPSASHESYHDALERLDLVDTELGKAWVDAGAEAMDAPTAVEPPVAETIYFDPREPSAAGYRFPVSRGRRVEIEIGAEHDRYFADVFRVSQDGEDEAVHVASRPEEGDDIAFEARRNAYYLLRVQPELLRGGRFDVRVTNQAPLAFPVEGHSPDDVWSYFGDGRDAGARLHHGIDIFAPRGTPVLAASRARVTRAGRRDRGGKIVVLRDEDRGINLYYAHLDEHRVLRGDEVEPGDVVGTVGNTGNARTTPPHLHIGIYQGGWRNPVDPWAYFVDPEVNEPPETTHANLAGAWGRIEDELQVQAVIPEVSGSKVTHENRNPFLRGAGDTFVGAEAEPSSEWPDAPAAPTSLLPSGTPVRVAGAAGDVVRVRTSDGATGFADPVHIRMASEIETETVSQPYVLRDPRNGDAFGELPAGEEVKIVGEMADRRVAVLASGRIAVLDPDTEASTRPPGER